MSLGREGVADAWRQCAVKTRTRRRDSARQSSSCSLKRQLKQFEGFPGASRSCASIVLEAAHQSRVTIETLHRCASLHLQLLSRDQQASEVAQGAVAQCTAKQRQEDRAS